MILPERTGPIADVLYSAAGNSADDQLVPQGHHRLLVRDRRRPLHLHRRRAPRRSRPASSRCFGAVGTGGGTGHLHDPALVNEGRDQAMEFAAGNFGMVESAYDYAMDTTAPKTSIEYSADAGRPVPDQLQVQLGRRGRGHPLHDRRLDADPRRRRSTTTSARAASARC